MNQYQQKGVLLLVGLATLLVSLSMGQPEVSVFRYFGYVSIGLSALLFMFDRYCWKWWVFYDWLVPVPNLNGKWNGAGIEKIEVTGADNKRTLAESQLNAKSVVIEQQFSSIGLKIEWTDGSVSKLKEPVSFAVSGRRTKVITFGAVYDYTEPSKAAEARNVSVVASMESRFFHNRPTAVQLTYAAGDRHGVINLSNRTDA